MPDQLDTSASEIFVVAVSGDFPRKELYYTTNKAAFDRLDADFPEHDLPNYPGDFLKADGLPELVEYCRRTGQHIGGVKWGFC